MCMCMYMYMYRYASLNDVLRNESIGDFVLVRKCTYTNLDSRV